MTESPVARPPLAERLSAGKALRKHSPRSAHADWRPAERDPVAILRAGDRGRLRELLPIRYGRMCTSPLGFLRGAAVVMAADLAPAPVTGLHVQACGDAHLLNFGGFSTPERRLVFDVTDFDESLAAPWEWDVKRLAASVAVAGRHLAHPDHDCSGSARAAVSAYREMMVQLAAMKTLDVWYARLDLEAVAAATRDAVGHPMFARPAGAHATAKIFPRLTTGRDGAPRIADEPPKIYHSHSRTGVEADARAFLGRFRKSLTPERRLLFDRFELADVAMKVVGVGSVGTRCAVALLRAGEDDPLFLQIKEARRSVLEPFTGRCAYANQGERVVLGQRLMQSASDIFLGWSRDAKGRDYYCRQLRDGKVSVNVEGISAADLATYAGFCGRALARAHARSGDAAEIAGYLGDNDRFDQALGSFALAYADQTARDHAALVAAVRAGRVRASLPEPGLAGSPDLR
ncbi:MAG TPA: DUF2252 domain-containing protein [Thermoanaerobaculia bacterium]|nr:DUF2252 domain-containing protein [Thermoanaerobaculia bacterium]